MTSELVSICRLCYHPHEVEDSKLGGCTVCKCGNREDLRI